MIPSALTSSFLVIYIASRVQLAEEKDNTSPNPDKVEALEVQLRELKREKMSLAVDNPALVNKALYIYAAVNRLGTGR